MLFRSDGQAVLPANSTLTNGTGTFVATLKTAGSQTITATDTVVPSITGTSNTIAVSGASATHFLVSAPSSAGIGFAFNFTVTAQDQFNNTATGYAGTLHFTSNDANATLPANSTLTNGVGTVSATLRTAGSRTITATDTVNASITGTSNTITVATATPTPTATPFPRPNVGVQVQPSGGTLQSTITARDAGCAQGNNQLKALLFTKLTNASVDVGSPPVAPPVTAAPPSVNVSIPSNPSSILLTVHRVNAGAATTVELTVTDGCGTWNTLVGGGPNAF